MQSFTAIVSMSSESNIISSKENQEQTDCLNLLTNLVESLEHGINIGIRILLCYRLSIQTGRSYEVLLTLNNSMQFFQETIRGPNPRKLEIARDIVVAYKIENQTLANFLAEEIVAHITQVIEGKVF